MQSIITAVKNSLPKFNNSLIIDHRESEINGLVEFIAQRYRECAGVANSNLELINYEILPPITRLNEELTFGMKKNHINIREDEAVLVNYNFRFYDTIHTVKLYIPYIFEDSTIIVGGTSYECLLSVTEKLFSIRSNSNGVTIKVIRSPISFWRNTLHAFSDSVTGEQFVGNIVSCKLYYKKTSKAKKTSPTIVHYLLCKFTLREVLMKFDIVPSAAVFVEHEKPEEGFYYFKVKNVANVKEQIFLKVDKVLINENRMLHDIVSAIIYLMIGSRIVNFADLMHDSKTIFLILLGKLVFSNGISQVHALSYMRKHLESLDTYLDNYTKGIFRANGVIVDNIYDLICFIAKNISQIIVSHPNNNMYNKRVEAINNVIIDRLLKDLYLRIYNYEKKPDNSHMSKATVDALKVSPKSILKTLGSSDSVRHNPAVYGDNWLLTIGNKVIKRLSAATKTSPTTKSKMHDSGINSPVNKFHPSMLVIESPVGFSSKPGVNCLVNPYAKIDENGGFVRDEFAEETAIVAKFSMDQIVKNQAA